MGVAQYVFTAATQVTSADVANCVSRWARYMDARLGQIYTVPVSTGATEDADMRKAINQWYAAAEILPRQRGGAPAGAAVLGMPADEAAQWRKQAEEMLTFVCSASPPLWGTATLATERLSDATSLISDPVEDSEGETVEAFFTASDERSDGDAGLEW